MNIVSKVARTTEDLFAPFNYQTSLQGITYCKCIALTNFGGDDTRAVYEIYIDNEPKFFAVSILEYPEDEAVELENIKRWTEAVDIQLIEKHAKGHMDYYLFELTSPFGISFGKAYF